MAWTVCPRTRELFPGTEMERYAAFAHESLKRTRTREFVPSQEEIRAIIGRQEMTTTVHCHGGGSCKITINSHTTAGEVSAGPRGRLSAGPPFTVARWGRWAGPGEAGGAWRGGGAC